MESYTLYQLNEYIRRVIALNFREPLWIEAEIAQVKESRGNFYIDFVEKEEDGDAVVAQMSGAIWYRNYQFIKKKLGDLIHDLLVDGSQVRVKCNVDFHERYGLKLVVVDIDPNYTFGQLEIKRQEIINRLEDEGLLELNKALLLPKVIQRVAVISSSKAAGYQDFVKQLEQNAYGYTFKVSLFEAAVQGQNVERDTTSAISEILENAADYDVVAIIRGGGSKLDLSGYDNYEIAKDIALSEIPFLIGIGHDVDQTVTDLVACLSLKTPTAVADFIVEKNMHFEAEIEGVVQDIHRMSVQMIQLQQVQLSASEERLSLLSRHAISEERQRLVNMNDRLSSGVRQLLFEQSSQLESKLLLLEALDPAQIMQRGYAYLKKEGTIVKSVSELIEGDQVAVHLNDGSTRAEII